jgi:hypothetical protein
MFQEFEIGDILILIDLHACSLDDLEKRKLTLPGLELRPLDRPARS